jgi:hypothetical protein
MTVLLEERKKATCKIDYAGSKGVSQHAVNRRDKHNTF